MAATTNLCRRLHQPCAGGGVDDAMIEDPWDPNGRRENYSLA